MNCMVGFDVGGGMEKYSNKMGKGELREIRRRRLSKTERFRELSAGILKVVLLFCVPVIISLVMLLVSVAIYDVRPFTLAKGFTKTTCKVVGHSVTNETCTSCSSGTDLFQPCLKILVSFPTASGEIFNTGVIMENEQALANCHTCSYTFGRHGLLHQYQEACGSWKENFDPTVCVEAFLLKNGVDGMAYPCYFNPENLQQVVKDLVVDVNTVIHAVSWPILSCVIYFLAWSFVYYDSKQRKIIERCIWEEIVQKRAKQEMERRHASEWRRQRLGETLGVRNEVGAANSFLHRPSKDLKRMSASLPGLDDLKCIQTAIRQSSITESTDDIENDEDLDLRHLDLAVSQQNIDDLTVVYPNMKSPSPLTYKTFTAEFGSKGDTRRSGLSRATFPILPPYPVSTFSHPIKVSSRSTTALFDYESSFSGKGRYKIDAPMFNRTMFYQQPRPQLDASVREDEIDGYYVVAHQASGKNTNDSILLGDGLSTDNESNV